MEIYPRFELTEQISEIREIQNGDTRSHKDFLVERQMTNVHRFQGRLLPYPNKLTIQAIPAFSCPESILPIQSSTICFIYYSNGIHNGSQGSQTDGSKQRYKDPPVPSQLVSQSHIPHLNHTQTLVAICQELGWIVNMEKSELELNQILEFIDYQYDLREGKVTTTMEYWQIFNLKIASEMHVNPQPGEIIFNTI